MAQETVVSLANDSKLVDDIEAVFKTTTMLSAKIRNILSTGVGGNPIPLYREFKEYFDFLFMLSCDYNMIRDQGNDITDKIKSWRSTTGMSYGSIKTGLKLFDEYKSMLFRYQILRFK